jgi:hypothetical protein
MCLVLSWYTGFLIRETADLLSTESFTAVVSSPVSSPSSFACQTHWHVAVVAVIYLASQKDRATTFYF